MKIKDIGEFGVIELLKNLVDQAFISTKHSVKPMLGIGDDAAAWETNDGIQIVTTDTLVEGVHFSQHITWEQLGWKALAVNLSDIAAMGVIPSFALITLGLNPSTDISCVQDMYKGLLSAAVRYDCKIIGGDLVRSPTTFITVSMTGASTGKLLTRHSALPGDLVAVTGKLGCSAGGVAAISQGIEIGKYPYSHLVQTHHEPIPRIMEGQALVKSGISTAMDISDGLVDDLSKICTSSQVGAIIRSDLIPTDHQLKEAFPNDHLRLALSGGEDYELLFTGTEELISEQIETLGIDVTVVGQIVNENPGRIHVMDDKGATTKLENSGWNHFT